MAGAARQRRAKAIGPDEIKSPAIDDPRIVKVVQLLLAGKDYTEVAAELRIAPSTLWQWRNKHHLDEMVQNLSREAMEATRTAYYSAHKRMFQRLHDMLGPKSPVETQKWAIAKLFEMRQLQPQQLAPSGAAPPAQGSALAKITEPTRAELVASARAELAGTAVNAK